MQIFNSFFRVLKYHLVNVSTLPLDVLAHQRDSRFVDIPNVFFGLRGHITFLLRGYYFRLNHSLIFSKQKFPQRVFFSFCLGIWLARQSAVEEKQGQGIGYRYLKVIA